MVRINRQKSPHIILFGNTITLYDTYAWDKTSGPLRNTVTRIAGPLMTSLNAFSQDAFRDIEVVTNRGTGWTGEGTDDTTRGQPPIPAGSGEQQGVHD